MHTMGSHSVIFVFTICTGFVTEGFASESMVVSLKGAAVLSCFSADRQHFSWTSGGQLVAQWSQGQFTVGPGYKGRIKLSKEGIEVGDFSVTISPVEYNDRGLYDCFTGSKHLAVVTLEVLVSITISPWVGNPVTLPCYANVNKQTDYSQLNIHWEKDGETVLLIQSGSVTTDSSFENRVNVSLDRVRLGDLSLTFSMARLSDGGAYQCFFKDAKGTPDGIILTVAAHQSNITIRPAESLLLPLYTTEPVHILFASDGSINVTVCSVWVNSLECGPQYQHRASVQNSTLTLEYTGAADSGVYRVMDHRTNDIINTVIVSVTVPLSEVISAVIFLIIIVFQMLVILKLAWLWHKSDIQRMIFGMRVMIMLLLLTTGLLLLGLSVAVAVKPEWNVNFALGVDKGLFIVFQMMTIYLSVAVPWRCAVLLLMLLVFLLLLVLSVTVKIIPGWNKWNLQPCLGLVVFLFFQGLLTHVTVKNSLNVIKHLQKTQSQVEMMNLTLLAQLQWLILLLVLGFLDLGASAVVVIMGLQEGLSFGLLVGMTMGMGLGVLVILKRINLMSKLRKQKDKTENSESLNRSAEASAVQTLSTEPLGALLD